jgi:hypothetical protein
MMSSLSVGAAWLFGSAMRRRAFSVVLALLGTVGFAIALVTLKPSLRLRFRGEMALEVRDLTLGAYRTYDGQNSRLYVVRSRSDEVWAFTVPLRAGKVGMPNRLWSHPAFNCSDFGPDAEDGSLTADSAFQCHDADVPVWGKQHWRWGLDGKSATPAPDIFIENMLRVSTERSAGVIRVYRWDILW